MPLKTAGDGHGARIKKCKDRFLSLLESVESMKKLEKGIPVKTLCEYCGVGSSTGYDKES